MSEFNIVVTVSGGRTSAFMAKWLVENKKTVADYFGIKETDIKYHFLFANTGREHEDTLRFLNDVNIKVLGNQLVWLEAKVNPKKKVGTKHTVVDYSTARRRDSYLLPGHPFVEYVKKYGVPNVVYKSCTRELKLRPIRSYLRSQGLKPSDVWTAVGIRSDETRRVKDKAEAERTFYPLIDLIETDKQDVLDFWEDYDYDLKIPEHRGNCDTCFKKSFIKLGKVWREDPHVFIFNDWIEKQFGFVGAEFEKHGIEVPRKSFREERNAGEIIAMFKEVNIDESERFTRDGGCSESCEVLELM